MSPLSLKTLSVLRMLVGTSCLLIPRQIGPLVGVPIVPESMVLGRMLGIRDFVLGAYLWKTIRDWEASKLPGSLHEADAAERRQPLVPKALGADGV